MRFRRREVKADDLFDTDVPAADQDLYVAIANLTKELEGKVAWDEWHEASVIFRLSEDDDGKLIGDVESFRIRHLPKGVFDPECSCRPGAHSVTISDLEGG